MNEESRDRIGCLVVTALVLLLIAAGLVAFQP